jgi:sugar lactone lactonase YvrE
MLSRRAGCPAGSWLDGLESRSYTTSNTRKHRHSPCRQPISSIDSGAPDALHRAMTSRTPHVLASDLLFPECPRWRAGRLWFSDQYLNRVFSLDETGALEAVATVPNHPSGLGWDAQGRLLIVSMHDRKLLRLEGEQRLVEVANLESYADFHCNDMVVDGKGRAYVGNFGFDLYAGANPSPTRLALVEPTGAVRVVAEDLLFPNGMIITPDETTLIVSETFGARLSAFDIDSDGNLSNRRVWAQLEQAPDGICLDEAGCVWVAAPMKPGGCLRVAEGGEVKERISSDDHGTYACMLGGADGKTLFTAEAREMRPDKMQPGNGRIRRVNVDVPRAGRP